MRVTNDLVFSAQSAGASANSSAVYTGYMVTASVQATTTSTAVGTLKIQYSNDPGSPIERTVPTNWSDVPSASVAVSSAGVYAIGKIDISYNWLRLVFTYTSGAGNITTAYIHGFGF